MWWSPYFGKQRRIELEKRQEENQALRMMREAFEQQRTAYEAEVNYLRNSVNLLTDRIIAMAGRSEALSQELVRTEYEETRRERVTEEQAAEEEGNAQRDIGENTRRNLVKLADAAGLPVEALQDVPTP